MNQYTTKKRSNKKNKNKIERWDMEFDERMKRLSNLIDGLGKELYQVQQKRYQV